MLGQTGVGSTFYYSFGEASGSNANIVRTQAYSNCRSGSDIMGPYGGFSTGCRWHCKLPIPGSSFAEIWEHRTVITLFPRADHQPFNAILRLHNVFPYNPSIGHVYLLFKNLGFAYPTKQQIFSNIGTVIFSTSTANIFTLSGIKYLDLFLPSGLSPTDSELSYLLIDSNFYRINPLPIPPHIEENIQRIFSHVYPYLSKTYYVT